MSCEGCEQFSRDVRAEVIGGRAGRIGESDQKLRSRGCAQPGRTATRARLTRKIKKKPDE